MTAVRSALFLVWFLAVTTVLSLVFLPVLILPRGATVWLARIWSRATFFGLKLFAGVDWEIRGAAPKGPVLVAAKHMSMWDTLALYLALASPAIVLKRSLLYIPFYGWFLWKATAIAIDRGAGAKALRKMSAAAQKVLGEAIPRLPTEPNWPEHRALDNALVTERKLWPKATTEKLGPIVRRFL